MMNIIQGTIGGTKGGAPSTGKNSFIFEYTIKELATGQANLLSAPDTQ